MAMTKYKSPSVCDASIVSKHKTFTNFDQNNEITDGD